MRSKVCALCLAHSELEHVVALLGLPADTDDLVCAESLCEQHTEVTETANSDDSDGLARSTPVLLEWRVNGDTTTQHRRGVCAVELLGDVHNEVAVGAVVGSVASV
jgi:hypothetical protein